MTWEPRRTFDAIDPDRLVFLSPVEAERMLRNAPRLSYGPRFFPPLDEDRTVLADPPVWLERRRQRQRGRGCRNPWADWRGDRRGLVNFQQRCPG